MDLPPQRRPHWRIDFKWIFGILTTLFFATSLLLFTASEMLSEEVAIPLATHLVALQFSPEGLDDPTDIEMVRQAFLASGRETYYPFPDNRNVSLSREEVTSLSPREIRLTIFRQMVEPYYYGGVETATQGLELTPEERAEAQNQAGLLTLLTQDTHELLARLFVWSLIPFVISLVGLIAFSYRYGRLISPAVVFLLVSTVPALFFFLIQHTAPPPGEEGPFSLLPRDLIEEIARSLAAPFNFGFLIGVSLLTVALLVRVLSAIRARFV